MWVCETVLKGTLKSVCALLQSKYLGSLEVVTELTIKGVVG